MAATVPAPETGTAPPTGTVTFLFTDVEGSTPLWERFPEQMRAALVRHDALIEQLTHQHGGHVVRPRGEGDSRFCVFSKATDAVAAASAIQRALHDEPWPPETPLRVRIALHTGEADLRDGDYYGSAVNRAARLRAIAHGGQTLLSQATFDLVRDSLPTGTTAHDLDEHRLKDLTRPERVYQLALAALPDTFPPLRSLDTLPNNLPLQLTSFVGREAELERAKRLLATTRLLTLTGTGGCGKTRLALQVAADLADDYAGGVWFVPLAAVADAERVPLAVAEALGVHAVPGQPMTTTLAGFLAAKELLLVLDNCEHVLDACDRLADSLLRGCPRLRIVATSREALGIEGERTWRIPSLGAPAPAFAESLARGAAASAEEVAQLTRYESVKLFIDRATAARSDFVVTRENAPAIAQICWRLDGIPLAIELAAARMRALTPDQIAQRLDDRFRLLTGGSRTALPRQQTLRALVDWSYDLLSDAEKTFLRRAAVFMGGFTLEAAEAVCPGDDIEEWEVVDLLARLVDRSLIQMEATGDGDDDARYRLLETIRLYAREKLLESGEMAAVRGRHLAWCLALAEPFGQSTGRFAGGLLPARLRLEADEPNLRAALEWAIDNDPATGLELAVRSGAAWQNRSHHVEGIDWLTRLLARSPERTVTHGRARLWHGRLCREIGRIDEARASLQQALEIAEEQADHVARAHTRLNLGLIARHDGDLARARLLYQEAGEIVRVQGVEWLRGNMMRDVGLLEVDCRDYGAARAAFEAADAARRAEGNGLGDGMATARLAMLARLEGDFPRARALGERSIGLLRAAHFMGGVLTALGVMGDVALAEGDYQAAASWYAQAVALGRDNGYDPFTPIAVCRFGVLASHQGDHVRAARLLAVPTDLNRASMKMHWPDVLALAHDAESRSRTALGDAAYDAAAAEGRAMSLPEAVSYALSVTAPSDSAAS